MIEQIIGDKSQWFWGMAQFLAIAISLAFIYRQVKLHRQGNMLQAIAALDQKWGSKDYIEYRLSTCQRYDLDSLKIDRSEGEVLGFFEDLGIYLERGVFDKSLLWEKYSYYIEHYWIMYEKHISEYRAQENDGTWFDRFEYVNSEMKKYAQKKRKVKYGSRTKNEIDTFIKGGRQESMSNKAIHLTTPAVGAPASDVLCQPET